MYPMGGMDERNRLFESRFENILRLKYECILFVIVFGVEFRRLQIFVFTTEKYVASSFENQWI